MASGGGLYRLLGVSRSASKDTVRAAYLGLAKKLHPDVNKAPSARQEFQKVREAYEVLSDESKRREYDRQMGVDSRSNGSGPSAGGPSASSWAMYDRARRQGGFYSQQRTAPQSEAEAMRRAREQAQEDIRARAQAHYYSMHGGFNQNRYQRTIVETMLRFVPLVIPLWLFLLIVGMHRRSKKLQDSTTPALSVEYDATGRAYATDAYGRRHRLPDFDR
eukprot:TRINITY_DN94428_c0_g1_i1.p1 TRINITY_DN94428_c0_g1~~TRINITY_DN94428_c0_g1_i1.p1  ORF type:complete len:234 (-),score=39.90 TRINITY_DN94428_c0_g1_i1:65-721(-)